MLPEKDMRVPGDVLGAGLQLGLATQGGLVPDSHAGLGQPWYAGWRAHAENVTPAAGLPSAA
eukprot:scaffold3068_cov401-Prasinococcus_capsulatus_cf.AAC.42